MKKMENEAMPSQSTLAQKPEMFKLVDENGLKSQNVQISPKTPLLWRM